MKTIVVSYSLTGNNNAFAGNVAKELGLVHVKITESKKRTTGSIIFDLILNRTPRVQSLPFNLDSSNLILFFAPVWMSQAATPLRACMKDLNANQRYAFISISGGADGPNMKLADDLKKRTGRDPVALLDLHIADLLPHDPKPTRKDTSAYKIKDGDIKKLTDYVVKALHEAV